MADRGMSATAQAGLTWITLPNAETLMAETPQNTDCFLGKSPDWLLGKSSSDFPESS
jgi:hypothetical protein